MIEPKDFNLEQLIEDNYKYLYGYAYRYFKSSERVEDLVQETFLAATEGIKKFEAKSSPRTWLTGILRHKILDAIKAKQKESREISIEDEGVIAECFDKNEHWTAEAGPLAWGSSPDSILKQKQFLITLESCMSKLPEKVKQIFLLREVEGYSRDEISGKTAQTSTNIGVILYRARALLQQCLQVNWFCEKKGLKK
jgi:RNA polymerase sigma-70 factor (ECF subfamily)